MNKEWAALCYLNIFWLCVILSARDQTNAHRQILLREITKDTCTSVIHTRIKLKQSKRFVYSTIR
jgi:hypothetical protein